MLIEADNFKIVPTIDFVFKKIFGSVGNEDITKDFVEAIIGRELKSISLEENTVLNKDEVDDKVGILDIRAKLDNEIPCDIEVQISKFKGIEKRLLFYWSKLYLSQAKKGMEYSNLKKTIVILISNEEIKNFEMIKQMHTEWQIRETTNQKMILTEVLEIHIIELPKIVYLFKSDDGYSKRLKSWVKFLVNSDDMEDEDMGIEAIRKAQEELDKIKDDEHARYLAELRLKHEMDVAELQHDAREEGREEGLEQGLERGREQMKMQMQKENEKNLKMEKLEIAEKLLEKGLSREEILEITGLSEDDLKDFLNE